MLPRSALRLLAVAGLAALALAGCGRRGALEPPQASAPTPAAVSQGNSGGAAVKTARILPDSIGLGGGQAEPEPEAVRAGDELPPSAIPPSGSEAPVQTTKGAKRGYRIPKDPFILDPLL